MPTETTTKIARKIKSTIKGQCNQIQSNDYEGGVVKYTLAADTKIGKKLVIESHIDNGEIFSSFVVYSNAFTPFHPKTEIDTSVLQEAVDKYNSI